MSRRSLFTPGALSHSNISSTRAHCFYDHSNTPTGSCDLRSTPPRRDVNDTGHTTCTGSKPLSRGPRPGRGQSGLTERRFVPAGPPLNAFRRLTAAATALVGGIQKTPGRGHTTTTTPTAPTDANTSPLLLRPLTRDRHYVADPHLDRRLARLPAPRCHRLPRDPVHAQFAACPVDTSTACCTRPYITRAPPAQIEHSLAHSQHRLLAQLCIRPQHTPPRTTPTVSAVSRAPGAPQSPTLRAAT